MIILNNAGKTLVAKVQKRKIRRTDCEAKQRGLTPGHPKYEDEIGNPQASAEAFTKKERRFGFVEDNPPGFTCRQKNRRTVSGELLSRFWSGRNALNIV